MTRDRLIGTWKVMVLKTTSGGKVSYPLGERPDGFVSITPTGFGSPSSTSARKAPAAPTLTDAEAIAAMKSHVAWTGKYVTDQTPERPQADLPCRYRDEPRQHRKRPHLFHEARWRQTDDEIAEHHRSDDRPAEASSRSNSSGRNRLLQEIRGRQCAPGKTTFQFSKIIVRGASRESETTPCTTAAMLHRIALTRDAGPSAIAGSASGSASRGSRSASSVAARSDASAASRCSAFSPAAASLPVARLLGLRLPRRRRLRRAPLFGDFRAPGAAT